MISAHENEYSPKEVLREEPVLLENVRPIPRGLSSAIVSSILSIIEIGRAHV